jgi:pimeloyl-ACP methyl ester carboxylesterase/DNA-binding winged helix-turn-helix (wHTH) protein
MHGLFRSLATEAGAQFVFDAYALDVARRELRCGADLLPLEPQVFDLLVFLIEHRDRVVSKDDLIEGVWGGRIVSDSTLTSRINAVRKAIGDSGEQQRLIRTMPRKGIRFVGEVTGAAAPAVATPALRPSVAAPRPPQEVRFCTAADGARIAYAVAGNGPPLVKAANWLNHIEYDWESPVWSHLLHALAARYRLVRYDERGNGLSDWNVDDISFDAFVRDLESVTDTVGIDRFPLFGVSGGCSVSILYALRHPQRVTHLVLYGGFARGRRKRGNDQEVAQSDALATLMLQGWGQENPVFRQIFTSMFIPEGSAEQWQWFNDLQRMTASPQNAVRLMHAREEVDIEHLLPQVQVPTLVLHCRDDARIPFEEGRRIAAGIKDARFVALEGRNHLILESEPAWGRMLEEITKFLQS